MIANISPASISFGESLSTLRYPLTNQFISSPPPPLLSPPCRVKDVGMVVGKGDNIKKTFQYSHCPQALFQISIFAFLGYLPFSIIHMIKSVIFLDH